MTNSPDPVTSHTKAPKTDTANTPEQPGRKQETAETQPPTPEATPETVAPQVATKAMSQVARVTQAAMRDWLDNDSAPNHFGS